MTWDCQNSVKSLIYVRTWQHFIQALFYGCIIFKKFVFLKWVKYETQAATDPAIAKANLSRAELFLKLGNLVSKCVTLNQEKQQKCYKDQVEHLCHRMKYDFKIMLCQWHDAGILKQHKNIGWIIKFGTLIQPSRADVRCSISLMNLICTLRKHLLPENLAYCMQICKDGKITDNEYDEILQKWLGADNTKSKKQCTALHLSTT